MLTFLGTALEVPGGLLDSKVQLNWPADNRLDSAIHGEDRLMQDQFNPTDHHNWEAKPSARDCYDTLVPLAAN